MFLAAHDDDAQQAHRHQRGNHPNHGDCIHGFLPSRRAHTAYLNSASMFLEIRMTAGPSSTTNTLGKMNSTSGKISFTVVLAANSSACCRRLWRTPSAKTRNARTSGVPKRSVCANMWTK